MKKIIKKLITNGASLKLGLQLMVFMALIVITITTSVFTVSYVVNTVTLNKTIEQTKQVELLEKRLHEKELLMAELTYQLEKQRHIKELKEDLNSILRDRRFDVNLIDEEHLYFMESQRVKYEIPKHIYYRTVYAESGFRMYDKEGNVLRSSGGALGYMQVLRSTFNSISSSYDLNIDDITDPYHNIVAGSFYLHMRKNNIERAFPGSSENTQWKLALSAYNAGIGKVLEARGIPDIEETINYVNFIMMNFSKETYASLNE